MASRSSSISLCTRNDVCGPLQNSPADLQLTQRLPRLPPDRLKLPLFGTKRAKYSESTEHVSRATQHPLRYVSKVPHSLAAVCHPGALPVTARSREGFLNEDPGCTGEGEEGLEAGESHVLPPAHGTVGQDSLVSPLRGLSGRPCRMSQLASFFCGKEARKQQEHSNSIRSPPTEEW